jgi:hypothetical protein
VAIETARCLRTSGHILSRYDAWHDQHQYAQRLAFKRPVW